MLGLKIIELSSSSTESYEEAIRDVSNKVSKNINNRNSVNIIDAKIKNNHIVEYCVIAEVSYGIVKI